MMERFCPACGQPLIERIPDGDNRLRQVCLSCHHIDYENPKIVTGVLPVWKGSILLCKRSIEPRAGFWTLPSGFMECRETLEEGALREAKEEAHLSLKLRNLYAVYSLPEISQVYFLFLADIQDCLLYTSPSPRD